MRKSRFSEEQIVAIIQEYAAGAKVSELCRKHGMSDATFYKWKAKYGDLQVSDVRRLKDLEAENGKLKVPYRGQPALEPGLYHGCPCQRAQIPHCQSEG
ncbi:MAG: transposase [Alphaproteobacteria bacterium]|nr:transposase [Alphaproteobacteria bacterium]